MHLPDPPAATSVSAHKVDATLAADGTAQIDWRADVTGVEASEWRARFHADVDAQAARAADDRGHRCPAATVTAVDAGDLEDVEQKVTMHVKGKAPQFARPRTATLDGPARAARSTWSATTRRSRRASSTCASTRSGRSDDWTVQLPPGAKLKSAPHAAERSRARSGRTR